MKNKRLMSFALALALCAGLVSPAALAVGSDFTVEDGVLVKYNGPGGEVVIPDGVTEIGEGAFINCEALTGVTFPASLTKIGDSAFSNCFGLTGVTIPGNVEEIGNFAFFECNRLAQVRIENPDIQMGSCAFDMTDWVIDQAPWVTVDGLLVNYLEPGTQAVEIPDHVTRIAGGAFYGLHDLQTVVIPDGVTEIGTQAFYNCESLTDVTVPDTVVKIGPDAFPDWTEEGTLTLHGAAGSYVETYAREQGIRFVADGAGATADLAYPSTQSVEVDGKGVEFQCYALKDANGYDTNYIKLRDLADILYGTAARFQVGWDGRITITTGQGYTKNGSEQNTPFSGTRAYERSGVTTLVNGRVAQLDSILLKDDNGGGYTYYKLRDLGQAIGFTVDWSAARGIYIETGTKDSQAGQGALANGKPITDDNIREIIYGLKEQYPEKMPWTNENGHYSPALRLNGYGCEGFALICSDAAFGDLPVTERHSDFDRVRVGDLLRINHDTHTVIVLEKKADSVVVAEGNYNSSIHWGREISRANLEKGEFTVRTRYPK